MDVDLQVKLAVYRAAAENGRPPAPSRVAWEVGVDLDELRLSYARLRERRLLVLEPDGLSIHMAPPFSGVPTQHLVRVDGVDYHANCAWDALGIPAALHRAGTVVSRCEQSREPLHLEIGPDGPEPSTWLFHCVVPAARWWEDIVFT
ncbi:MAG: organomercurial lyase [Candidatus Eiseniibacteriota bacterium]